MVSQARLAAAQRRERQAAATYAESRYVRLAKAAEMCLEELRACRREGLRVSPATMLALEVSLDAVNAMKPMAGGNGS
jgi:hypothetical protein